MATKAGTNMEIRIVLADACDLFREGIRLIVESEPDMHIVAMAPDGQKALQVAEKKRPAIVILDAGLPVLNGIDLTRKLCESTFPPKVLCLSAYVDSHHLSGVLTAGASGYLPKIHSADELIRAIRVVAEGDIYISPKVAREVVAGYVENYKVENESSCITQLTARERQILQLVAEGIEGRNAAECLGVSPKTIYSHLEHIMKKLNANSIADLTKHALREGLTTL